MTAGELFRLYGSRLCWPLQSIFRLCSESFPRCRSESVTIRPPLGCLIPDRSTKSNSNSDSWRHQQGSLPVESVMLSIHFRRSWSVRSWTGSLRGLAVISTRATLSRSIYEGLYPTPVQAWSVIVTSIQPFWWCYPSALVAERIHL